MITFSVAIAVYNVAQYLRPCMESICKQLEEDVEVLLVDDGSTDGSGAICDEFAHRYSRIRVIHQINSGISAVRNVLIQQAKGKWIVFVDGDDILTDDALQVMRSYADSESELIVFEHQRFFDTFHPEIAPFQHEDQCFAKEEIADLRLGILKRSSGNSESLLQNFTVSACAKMWKLRFLHEMALQFSEELKYGEDLSFMVAAMRNMERIRWVHRCVYGYRINPSSFTMRFYKDADEICGGVVTYVKRDMESHMEMSQEALRDTVHELEIYCFQNALIMSIQHPDCPWNRAKRLAWLRELCSQQWVQSAIAYATQAKFQIVPLRLAREENYAGLERYCNRKRMRYRFVRWLNRSVWGRRIVKLYSNKKRGLKIFYK